MYMFYYGSFVLQCYVLSIQVMTSTVGGNLTNRPPALRYIHVNKKQGKWIGYILHGNCLLQHVIEGKTEGGTEVTGRRERRRKQLLDDPKEKSGYWKLKLKDVSHSLWKTRV